MIYTDRLGPITVKVVDTKVSTLYVDTIDRNAAEASIRTAYPDAAEANRVIELVFSTPDAHTNKYHGD